MKNLLVLILALFIVSCSSGEASKLSDANLVALSYVKNSKNLDFNLAYELLSEEDKNFLSKEDYKKFKEPEVMMEIAKAVALQSEYKIKETSNALTISF